MNKVVCYTCITGSYDSLKEPIVAPDNVDFICFTDNPYLRSKTWLIRLIPEELLYLSKVKQQRVVKICPHRYLKEYDISIWIDGAIYVKDDLNKFIALYDLNSCSIYTRVHPVRNCIYDEAAKCVELKKDIAANVDPLIDFYKTQNYPAHIGMCETNIILRKHNDRSCIKICNEWATELLRFSHRDQLSFNYVCWKNKFLVGHLTHEFVIVKNKNNFFEWNYRHG